MTGCGISGGMVPAGVTGRTWAHRLEDSKALPQHHHGLRTGSIPLFVETTTICGTNGGMVPAGVIGKTLEHQEEAFVLHREPCPGAVTGWMPL